MSKISTILLCSALVVILPFTGFPQSWKDFFTFILGLLLVVFSYSIRKTVKADQKSPEEKNIVYSENKSNQ